MKPALILYGIPGSGKTTWIKQEAKQRGCRLFRWNVRNDREEGHLRWTVDDQRDFDMVQRVYAHFKGKELSFDLDDLRGFFD